MHFTQNIHIIMLCGLMSGFYKGIFVIIFSVLCILLFFVCLYFIAAVPKSSNILHSGTGQWDFS